MDHFLSISEPSFNRQFYIGRGVLTKTCDYVAWSIKRGFEVTKRDAFTSSLINDNGKMEKNAFEMYC